MKYILAITIALFASTCYAHGGWKPCIEPVHASVPYPYPQVVVPAQPVQTLSVDSLLYFTTSKTKLLCIIPKIAHNLCAYHKMGKATILQLLMYLLNNKDRT